MNVNMMEKWRKETVTCKNNTGVKILRVVQKEYGDWLWKHHKGSCRELQKAKPLSQSFVTPESCIPQNSFYCLANKHWQSKMFCLKQNLQNITNTNISLTCLATNYDKFLLTIWRGEKKRFKFSAFLVLCSNMHFCILNSSLNILKPLCAFHKLTRNGWRVVKEISEVLLVLPFSITEYGCRIVVQDFHPCLSCPAQVGKKKNKLFVWVLKINRTSKSENRILKIGETKKKRLSFKKG